MSAMHEGVTPPQESKEIMPNSKVGLSLSICVGDILHGTIKEEEVKEIIAGTNVASHEQWEELLKNYREGYRSHILKSYFVGHSELVSESRDPEINSG